MVANARASSPRVVASCLVLSVPCDGYLLTTGSRTALPYSHTQPPKSGTS